MGNIVVKYGDEFYPEDRDITKLLKYISGECKKKEKARYCNGRGVPLGAKQDVSIFRGSLSTAGAIPRRQSGKAVSYSPRII